MLGIGWLIENRPNWDFARGEVCIDGVSYRLAAGRTRGKWCRRVKLVDDVTVPPQSQLDLFTDTVYRQLHTAKNSAPQGGDLREEVAWTTETSELRKELLVARTLIPERAHGVPVRLMNTTDAPVHLCRGAMVSELHPVVTSIDQQNQSPTKKEALSEDEIVTDLLSRVADDVSDYFKDRLGTLLKQHITVFSTGEYHLGWTNLSLTVLIRVIAGQSASNFDAIHLHILRLLTSI